MIWPFSITGFSIQKIEDIVGENQHIIRSMPNTAIAVGKSMTCLCANSEGKKRIKIAERNRFHEDLTSKSPIRRKSGAMLPILK